MDNPSSPMLALMQHVARFHRATNTPVLNKPLLVPADRLQLRISLIEEEYHKELKPALEKMLAYRQIIDGDLKNEPTPTSTQVIEAMVHVLDALGDSIYVIVGTAVELGLPLHHAWAIIQEANMRKINPTTGEVTRREDGKILKPEGWVPPEDDIRRALIEAGQEPSPVGNA